MASQQELVEQLFEAVLALKPMERGAFLDRVCGNDQKLKLLVENLLAEDARAGSFLQHQPIDFPDETTMDPSYVGEDARSVAGNNSLSNPGSAGRLRPGQTLIERFIIVRFIKRGGMGEVYEVEDQFLQGTHVALKTILPQIADDPALKHRFEREVLLAREVLHPNLCPIYEIFHCGQPPDGFLFLTMKLLPGDTLAERLNGPAPIPVKEQVAILKQLAAGLVAIHDAGIIHRDIKPNNVMLEGKGEDLHLWITDFGLARAFESQTTLSGRGVVAGTPGYIAPELILGHPPSQASDLYAFGVVLHEVVTGHKPAPAPDNSSVIVSPQLNSLGIPSFFAHLIRECLNLDPNRRCQAFNQALVSLGLKRHQRKPWTRRKFVSTSAACICTLGGAAWWERERIEDFLHPLPQKRFVAVLNWPTIYDTQVAPVLTGVLNAIKTALVRFEAFDRDLFVISPEDVHQEVSSTAHLKDVCIPLGANLALAISGFTGSRHIQLSLRLLDPLLSQPIRKKELSCVPAEITSLPGKAVQAAASLLNLNHYLHNSAPMDPGTQSVAGYNAYQSAEALMKQPNDSGLDAAISKYKEAIELDPRYALAHAELAIAYGRLHALRHDPAALDLARGNCEVALGLDPGLVDGHLARASVLEQTGDELGALKEIGKALALDPSNARTLVWQGQIYTRLDRWADAEQSFGRVLKERPNYWMAYNDLGVALNQQGKYPEAIRAFRSACLAAPGNALAFNNLGAVYLQIGNFSDATENFKKSVALKPNGMAASNTSLALRSEGKPAEALPFALKSVELDSGNDANWLELGDGYSCLRGHQAEATAAYKRAEKEAELHLQTNANDGPTWMTLALYQVKSGNRDKALSLIEKAESLGAGDIDSQLTKARILEVLGKRTDALNTLAASFRRGATRYEIEPVPDFQSLQKDPRYQEILRSNSLPRK